MISVEDLLTILFTDRWLIRILLWSNYALAVGFAFNEIIRSRTSQGSIGWLLSLALLPFPTTLFYLVFGLKVFDDYANGQVHSGRVMRRVRNAKQPVLDENTSDEWPVLANVSQIPFLTGNDAELLIDGDATFKSIFEGISRAQKFILVQFYIIHDDELGREFADRLIERARAGVKIYLLYDDVGCFWLPWWYRRRLRKEGIRMLSFNHRHRLIRVFGPTRINWRNHRKVMVVDAKEAWVGGLNVGDEYVGKSKTFGHWRDTHVHFEGPAVLAAMVSFREDWEWATGQALELPPGPPLEVKGKQSILVMPTGPADKIEGCSVAFSEVIARAEKRLWIVSPYFVPDLDMQTALFAAAMRGVDVRVLIPEVPDHRLVWLASIAHSYRMISHDVHVYRYNKGFLHEKVILVDDKIAGVGTVNFDNRSFRINFEITLWFTYAPMLKKIEAMLETDFGNSKEVTLGQRMKQPLGMRFLSQAARLFSPIL
jgi:cardiolipin synthase